MISKNDGYTGKVLFLMQVLCKISPTHHDVTCRICGQGFLVYWARTSRAEREETRQEVVEALARQHSGTDSAHAHPRTGFTVPNWSGVPSFSGAALLGGAQSWSI